MNITDSDCPDSPSSLLLALQERLVRVEKPPRAATSVGIALDENRRYVALASQRAGQRRWALER